jgi:hypothetical protein
VPQSTWQKACRKRAQSHHKGLLDHKLNSSKPKGRQLGRKSDCHILAASLALADPIFGDVFRKIAQSIALKKWIRQPMPSATREHRKRLQNHLQNFPNDACGLTTAQALFQGTLP